MQWSEEQGISSTRDKFWVSRQLWSSDTQAAAACGSVCEQTVRSTPRRRAAVLCCASQPALVCGLCGLCAAAGCQRRVLPSQRRGCGNQQRARRRASNGAFALLQLCAEVLDGTAKAAPAYQQPDIACRLHCGSSRAHTVLMESFAAGGRLVAVSATLAVL